MKYRMLIRLWKQSIFLAGYNAKNIDKVFSDILLNQPGAGKDIEVVGREILDMQFKPRN